MWGALLAAGLAYEAYGLYGDVEGDTLSEVTRAVFQVHDPVGKTLFVAAWTGLTVWFVPHIVAKQIEAAVDALDDWAHAHTPAAG